MSLTSLRLNPKDQIAIALQALTAGQEACGVKLAQNIPQRHKFALQAIAADELVYRYGQIIGQATQAIGPGEHVHSHNLGMLRQWPENAKTQQQQWQQAEVEQRTFQGYVRANGKVGTRNYLGIITSVNCAGSVARFIARQAESKLLPRYEHIDGVVPIVHGTGCGMSNNNEGYAMLKRTLAGYAQHANFAGVLILGLGCEVMQVAELNNDQQDNIRYMTIQREGGTKHSVERGLEELEQLAQVANQARRSTVPASAIVLGMQCGGSDGYSGISANPALGHASDLLVHQGATTILSETPEICGAEHLLADRAVSPEVATKLLDRVEWWQDYCRRNGDEVNNNPSPGNKRGGLTTILEKSLGAVAKSGSAPLQEVYLFAESIDKPGLVHMDSPGFDPCSVTGQIASGANLIAFTTGMGSVSGYMPSPCVKIASNSAMYQRLQDDMDLNCGDIIDSGVSIATKGEQLFELMLRIASGEPSKSEALGFGEVEFVPWQLGAVV